MKDEIKEILDKWKKVCNNELEFVELTIEQMRLLLDYITNLQERNEKAIEYIKGWQSFPHTNGSTHNELRNLLNILGDKNE